MQAAEIEQVTGLRVYERSVCTAEGVTYFLGRRGRRKLVGSVGSSPLRAREVGAVQGESVLLGPLDAHNAAAVRSALPWSAPRLVGLEGSIGLGDRLGLATPGHVRAVQDSGLRCVLAQQSIREITRTGRTPQQVLDAATWGVLQEGYRDGFGSDADHLREPQDIDGMVAAGFTMFTIDPGAHVNEEADCMAGAELGHAYEALDFEGLQTTAGELRRSYAGKSFALTSGGCVRFEEEDLLRAAVKYGAAAAHVALMHRHLERVAEGEFEVEVSVDETESPTSAAEHYFFAAEMKRLGVRWVSLAPRYVGRFEKGVDYIGDLEEFRRSFAEHVAVMRTLGPYKLSVHSGSDKFRIYPTLSELTGGMLHVKTAGTSYLAALEAIAHIDPPLFRGILRFARERYDEDRATYHVSAEVAEVPAADAVRDSELPELVHEFNTRQVLHVTFGSVLSAEDGQRFAPRILRALEEDEETHYQSLQEHLGRHVELLTRS